MLACTRFLMHHNAGVTSSSYCVITVCIKGCVRAFKNVCVWSCSRLLRPHLCVAAGSQSFAAPLAAQTGSVPVFAQRRHLLSWSIAKEDWLLIIGNPSPSLTPPPLLHLSDATTHQNKPSCCSGGTGWPLRRRWLCCQLSTQCRRVTAPHSNITFPLPWGVRGANWNWAWAEKMCFIMGNFKQLRPL